MKSTTKTGILALFISSVMLVSSFAQPRNGRGAGQGQQWNQDRPGRCGIENVLTDLTDDQKATIEDLRTEHYKKMKDLRNQMGELNAKQRTIMSAYDIDEKAASKVIDEKSALMNKQMKARTAHRASVNQTLTEEQVLQLEQHRNRMQMSGKNMRGHRGGWKSGQGRGCGAGPCGGR